MAQDRTDFDYQEEQKNEELFKYLKRLEADFEGGEAAPRTAEENIEQVVRSLTHQVIDVEEKFQNSIRSLDIRIKEAQLMPSSAECAVAFLTQKKEQKINCYTSLLIGVHNRRREYRDKMLEPDETVLDKLAHIGNVHDKVSADLQKQRMTSSLREFEIIEDKIKILEKIIIMDKVEVGLEKNWNGIEFYEYFITMPELYTLTITPSGKLKVHYGGIVTLDEAGNLIIIVEEEQEEEETALEKVSVVSGVSSPTVSGPSIAAGLKKESESDMPRSTAEAHYLKDVLGIPLTMALTEIMIREPRDPIQYLAHWLMKYRYNRGKTAVSLQEVEIVMAEREKLRREKLHRILEDEARNLLYAAMIRAEEIASQNELERLAREAEISTTTPDQLAFLAELERIAREIDYVHEG